MFDESGSTWSNWSNALRSRPEAVHCPNNPGEIRTVIDRARRNGTTIRVAGAGHSFSPLVPTDELMISLENHTGIKRFTGDGATIRAGTELAELASSLNKHGLAMKNMGDVDRQTIAGAISTGTHGTGISLGNLSDQVSSLRLCTPEEGMITCDPERNADVFDAARVSLGALGIIVDVTLDLVPRYNLLERVRTVAIEHVLSNIDTYREKNRHFEFFWFPGTDEAIVKTLNLADRESWDPGRDLTEWFENLMFEGICRTGTRWPDLVPYLNEAALAGVRPYERSGSWHRIFPTRRTVRFNEMEYGVPAEQGPEVFQRLRNLVESEHPEVQFPVEYRYTAADQIPLSPSYGRDTAFIAVHKYHQKPYENYFRGAEEVFREYGGRPHWGKIHFCSAEELSGLYPEWDRFKQIRDRLDPARLCTNHHLERLLGD